MTAFKNLFESKAFILALLSAAAAAGAVFGFNVPVAMIMAVLTPIMVAIGAAGWSDVTQMKAKMALAHEVKMHALNAGLVTHQMLLDGAPVPVKTAQAGFARIHMMVLIAVLGVAGTVGLVSTQSSCGSTPPVVTDVINCAKAEAEAVASGFSIIQVVNEVVGVLTGKPLPGCEQAQNVLECDAEQLILKFGGDIVACVLDSVPEPAPAPAAGSGSAAPPLAQAPLVVIHKHELLQKHFAGKKIVHDYKKGSK